MANVLEGDIIINSEFNLQSRYYVPFKINTFGKVWAP